MWGIAICNVEIVRDRLQDFGLTSRGVVETRRINERDTIPSRLEFERLYLRSDYTSGQYQWIVTRTLYYVQECSPCSTPTLSRPLAVCTNVLLPDPVTPIKAIRIVDWAMFRRLSNIVKEGLNGT